MSKEIAGYTHGSPELLRSPISLAEFERMKESALFGPDDVAYLRKSYGILRDQTEQVLDVWYGFVGSQPQLLASFQDKSGAAIGEYLARVRKRFAQWILDTARAEYDQAWLDYQHEIGLRHHRSKKNQTDGVASTSIVPFRDLFALIFPVTFTLKPFLANKGDAAAEVEKMYTAWLKSSLLQVTLWSHPYVRQGDF